ncbi:MAG: FAD-dependent oxidoreductase, partial [Candidatus Paceibacteria bacterium]
LGTLLSVIGATLGASLAFVLARSLGEPFVRSILKQKLQRVYAFNQKLAQNGFFTVIILRLVPVIPFNGLNFALGVTRVKFVDYLLATALGIIPGALIFALGGDSLAMFDIMNLAIAIALFGGLTWLTYKLKQSGIMDQNFTDTSSVQSASTSNTNEYDVIVIGAGAAGLNTAVVLNEMGFRVLLVERNAEQIGGDCLNYGCVPSKALLHVAKTVHTARQAETFGVNVSGAVDMASVKNHINQVKNEIREHENVEYFRNKGIHIELGEASFVDEQTIEVNESQYKARRIVVATGSRPRVISIPGDEQVTIHTNETIFDLENVPSHLVVLGGGPIGMEIAQAYRYLGSEVSVVTLGERILEAEDPEISHLMQQRLENQGINFYLQYTAKEFMSNNKVTLESADGEQTELTFDTFLMAIGRYTAPSESLHVEKAGITTYEGHIAVNDRLQTSNPRVFVCGDAS